ncbi:MAG: hypothetical protein P1V97_03055 [Planctomycetota bacterium]|nr:hypothetical protein [Planctomycetota bacterium]
MRQGFIAIFFVLLLAGHAEAKVSGLAYDAVTVPGKTVTLGAKFEKNWGPWVRPDIKKEMVSFTIDGASIGQDKTDGQGKAHVQWTPKKAGVFQFNALLVKRKFTVTGTIRVLEVKNKVLVFDIDGTISDMSEWLILFRGHKARAFPHAPKLLQALAKDYSIVYLTARDDSFSSLTEAFLKRHKFPKGTIIYNEYGGGTDDELGNQLNPKNHAKFKLAVLKKLKKQGLNLVAGIGNAKTDAEAYTKAKISSYIRSEESYSGSYSFLSYRKLQEKLESDGIYKTSGVAGALRGSSQRQ